MTKHLVWAPILGLLLSCNGGASGEDAAALVDQGPPPPTSDSTTPPPPGADAKAPTPPPDASPPPPLPKNCPCPPDSYCDLATNSCVAGCREDAHCSKGKYCDKAVSLCKVGCRSSADCSDDGNGCTDLACTGGSCVHVPNKAPCADDGNSCTADVCSGGTCTHPPANNGKLCGATKDCSDFRCQNGACAESFFKAGTACPDDKDVCTSDTCDGAGSCKHATVPDGTTCPNTWGGWDAKCFKGVCYPKRYQCCGYSSLTYLEFSTGKTDTWDGTTSCGCSGSTMKWSGWYSGYKLDHSEYCSGVCDSPSGAYCQSCYDLP